MNVAVSQHWRYTAYKVYVHSGPSTQDGNEADCLNKLRGIPPPPPETTTLDDISKFCMKFGHLILRKIIKFVVTRCQTLRPKCTKFDLQRSTPKPRSWINVVPYF